MPPSSVQEARKEHAPWPPWSLQREHRSLFPLHTLAKGGRLLSTLEHAETCQAGGDTSAAFATITSVVPAAEEPAVAPGRTRTSPHLSREHHLSAPF